MTKPKTHSTQPPYTQPSKGLARSLVRSQDLPTLPDYKMSGAGDIGPEVAEILSHSGLLPSRTLSIDEVQSLIKTSPDTLTVADDVLSQYGKDHSVLQLRDFPPETLEALVQRAAFLRVRPAHLQAAADIAQHQQLLANSDLQDALLRIRRRLVSLQDEWPELQPRWQFLLDYFERRYPGRPPEPPAPPATEPPPPA